MGISYNIPKDEHRAMMAELDRLKAENAELRNLVGGLIGCTVNDVDCEGCEHVRVVPNEVTGNWPRYVCTLARRAKELGIEVG